MLFNPPPPKILLIYLKVCLSENICKYQYYYYCHYSYNFTIILCLDIRTGIVAKYDYGVLNQARYGQPTPPLYNLANIPKDFPLLLSYGGNDYLSDVNDVNVLLNELQDHDQDKLVVQFVDDYAHADFILADDANTKVYQPIMEFFQLHYWIQPVIYSVY